MSKNVTDSFAREEGEEIASPLLPLSSSEFTATSTGSMELVGARERKPYRASEFESQYRQPEEKSTAIETVREVIAKQRSKFSWKKSLVSNFPILSALQRYNVLRDLPNDVIAGLTAGIMMIPQGLAFASLSTLKPIIGLYISLFSSLTYFVLGTGQQTSFGCIAILSIMMGSILDRYETRLRQSAGGAACVTALPSLLVTGSTPLTTALLDNSSWTTPGFDLTNTTASIDSAAADPLDIEAKKLQVAGGVTMLCGIIFVILGKIGFGKVTVFMSDALVTGVTVGAAFHVGSSQLKTMFGLSFLPRYSGMFKLLKLWYSILANIHHSNLASLIAAAICILVVYLVKRFVNEKYKDRLRVPVPIELFMLIVATIITYYADLNAKYGISIVKEVPVGVPSPSIPDLSLGVEYVTDGLVIIIVAFAQTVSVAKLMGLKHNYKVDSNQEMFALGVVNVVCSIFSGYISGASVSRTVVQDSAGGKTQIASLFAAFLVLMVMLFFGPYFYYVPKVGLSAIIIVSLRSLMLKLLTIPDVWRKSKMDCVIFVGTVAAVVILDADIGLLVGVVTSVFLVLFQSMSSCVDTVAPITVDETSHWRSKEKYFGGDETVDVKVVRINYPLYFVNAEIVTNDIFKKTGLNPLKMKKKEVEVEVKPESQEANGNGNASQSKGPHADAEQNATSVDIENGGTQQITRSGDDKSANLTPGEAPNKSTLPLSDSALPFTFLIVDLSGVSFLDLMGVKALEFVISKYKSIGVSVFVTNVSENAMGSLKTSGFLAKHGVQVFLTIETALAFTHTSQKKSMKTEHTKM